MGLRPESRSSYGEVLKEAIGEAGANVHVCVPFLRVFYKVKSRSAHMKSHAEQEKKAAALKQQEKEAAAAAARSQAQQDESSDTGSSTSGSSSASSDEDGEI